MPKPKIVFLDITTWSGISIGAEHYYGKLKEHGGNYKSVELEWPMSQKMATYLNKKDRTRSGDSYDCYKKGCPTVRFDTEQEVKDWALEVWKEHFPDHDLLLIGTDCINEPIRCLDGDSMLSESINQLVDKYDSLDDLRIPAEREKSNALSEIFHRLIKSGDLADGYRPTMCPKCKSEDGYYTKEIVKYRSLRFFFSDDIEGEVGDLVRGGDRWYCMNCERDLTELVAPFIVIENM